MCLDPSHFGAAPSVRLSVNVRPSTGQDGSTVVVGTLLDGSRLVDSNSPDRGENIGNSKHSWKTRHQSSLSKRRGQTVNNE